MQTDTKNKNEIVEVNKTNKEFGTKIGLLAKLFGCWHRKISRPFTHGKRSYVDCLQCGARKHFNANSLQTYGEFHFPPEVQQQTAVYN